MRSHLLASWRPQLGATGTFIAGLLIVTCSAAPIDRDASAPLPGPAAPGPQADWWSHVRHDLAAREYAPSYAEGVLQAPNRAQNLRAHFREAGVELVPRASSARCGWQWSWQTLAWGREHAMHRARGARPRVRVDRVEYARGALLEWYENRENGVEQGFTIASAPGGSGRLRIEGRLGAAWTPVLRDGDAVEFRDAAGVARLRYGALRVTDAGGRALPAALQVEGDRMAIVADDRDARYPVTVDPLLDSPAWTNEPDQTNASYGFSVSTAGDVNGDGFSDVIVGAIFYDHGTFDEGSAFLYHGSAAGLSSTPSWSGESNQASGWYGYSVSTAGDVNGDGFDDIIVGTPNLDRGVADCGAAWVYLGSDTGAVGLPHRSYFAPTSIAGGQYGRCVATAGDVNNDGYADVIVGAPGQDGTTTADGVAYVYHGSASGLSLTPNWSHFGVQADAFYGESVAGAGDVNGDGYSDAIIGASLYDNGQGAEGRAYVFLGGVTGLATNPVWTQESNQAGATFGSSVASAGDVNGDGYADILVAAMLYDDGSMDEGRVSLYMGSASGPSLTAQTSFEGNQVSPQYGRQVATAGDVNGDGFADFVIGAPFYDAGQADEGRVYVYYGNANAFWLFNVADWTNESDQVGALFGLSVGTAGDVNGDGFSDLIVGSPSWDNGQADEGRALLYYGSPSRVLQTAAWTVEGAQVGASLGGAVASAGDVNADGFGDVLVAAPDKDDGEVDEGVVYLYLGTASGLAASPAWIGEGNQAMAHYGAAVSSAGDVNGDGYDDILVGAPKRSNGQASEGQAFVYYGYSGGMNTSPAWTGESNQSLSDYGAAVARAGDVNGDGFSDIIVGADRYDGTHSNEGAAFVYYGSAGGPAASPNWTEHGAAQDAYFGTAVAGAGDVNGDGWSDVLVGAPGETSTQASEGVARCYHGFVTGLSHVVSWGKAGLQAGSDFGAALSSAGDVNGDGYSDVVIGDPAYVQGLLPLAGRAQVFKGSASGLVFTANTFFHGVDSTQYGACVAAAGDIDGDGFGDFLIGGPTADNGATGAAGIVQLVYGGASSFDQASWSRYGTQASEYLGTSAAGAGDVNGDGYPDVVIGSPGYDNGSTDEGLARLFYGNQGDGLDRPTRAVRSNATTPIAFLGASDEQNTLWIRAKCRTAAGRGKVRATFEVKPLGSPFSGGNLTTTSYATAAGSGVTFIWPTNDLSMATPYRWRVRSESRDPFFPRTPWHSLAWNTGTETDVRTGGTLLAVGGPPRAGALWLAPPAPNPSRDAVALAYALPARARVRLVVFDAQGRRAAELVDAVEEAGEHRVVWRGREASGGRARAGVYFARLQAGAEWRTARIVVAE